MTCDSTCTVACSQGTSRPFIQIVSAFAMSAEYRAGCETISRHSPRSAKDERGPGGGSAAIDRSQAESRGGAQEPPLVVHQDARQDGAPAAPESDAENREDPLDDCRADVDQGEVE